MELAAIRDKSVRYGVGLMSGTSCDGVDAALVRLKGTGADLHIKFIRHATYPYPDALRLRLLAPRIDASELCALNFVLGEYLANAASRLLADVGELADGQVDFIASSGHTVAHLPPRDSEAIGTLQIGESAVIAERCKLPVVSDFRQRDMAVGGQGAPLVPHADWVLFHRDDRTVALLNIGGIANITVVTPERDRVIAFDTGPGNMAIDGAVRMLTGGEKQMDLDGQAAKKGVVIDEFMDQLLDHPYFSDPPPKSTGREEFGPEVYLRDGLLARRDRPYEDLVATVTAAVAFSIIRAYGRFVKPGFDVSRLIVSGGGAHNKTLMDRLVQGLPDVTVCRTDKYGIPVDAREAIAFAILGNETLCGTPANIPGATGATHGVVLGKITPG